jgi:5'-nucleotidase/UDP-sugar diphosphatase
MHRVLTITVVAGFALLAGCQNTKSRQPLAEVPPPPSDAMAEVYVPPAPATASHDYGFTQPAPAATSYTPPAPAPATAVNYGAPAGGRTYVVQNRDTLWSIAARHYGDGKRWRDIAAANGISNERRLMVGQTLVLP